MAYLIKLIRLIHDNARGYLFCDRADTGGLAQQQITKLSTDLALSNNDFVSNSDFLLSQSGLPEYSQLNPYGS